MADIDYFELASSIATAAANAHRAQAGDRGAPPVLDELAVQECERLRQVNASLLAEIESAFLAIGRVGANGDLTHPLRPVWESLRGTIRQAQEAAT